MKAAEPKRRRRTPDSEPRFVASGVPLYYQLATLMRQQIVTGEHRPGDKIPPESKLVEDYGVSRMTVRQAMRSLEEEGLIRREPGRGTFVTERAPETGGDLELDCSIDDLISMGMATSVQLLSLEELPATPAEARDLELQPGEPIVCCRRLRMLRRQPYCYIVNRLPAEIGRRIGEPNWRQGSVLRFVEEQLSMRLRIARQRLRATLADAVLARWLGVRVGAPLLLVDYHIRTDEGRPVETAELYYRSDLYSFTLHLTREESEETTEKWSLRQHRFEH